MANAQHVREWGRENGFDVPARGRIPADLESAYYESHPGDGPAGAAVDLLPSPEEAGWDDLGEVGPDIPEQARPEWPPYGPQIPAKAFRAVPADDGEAPEDAGTVRPDSGPAHGRRDWHKSAGRKAGPPPKGKAPRVTVGIRADIDAKIRFGLMVPGKIWEARDPLCGGVFVAQSDEIAEALTEIVCDSPDLVAFFTGPGGGFMRYLKLITVLMPVAQTAMAHHVYHTVAEDADPLRPGYPYPPAQYAA